MKFITRVFFSTIVLLFVHVSSADDAPQPSWAEAFPDLQGDAAAGREAAKSCDVCHGDEGFSEHRYYPVLAGQKNKYLVFQLHRYRSSIRAHPLMTPLTQDLSDQDIADLSAYYSAVPITKLIEQEIDPESRREIKHIAGGLFNVQDENNTFTAFLVTSEGIILTDPINHKTASWIKAELDRRFDVPVKYVIYSHHHDDHAPGAELFEDAIIIAHKNVVAALAAEPDNPALQPHMTFADRMTITLGGKTVNLIYIGESHTDNLIVVHYPDERALLAVDSLWIDRVAYGDLGHNSYFPGWIDALRVIESVDFDTLLVAHGHYGKASGFGSVGTKDDVVKFLAYFEALNDAVVTAKKNGLSLEQAVETIELEQFSHMDMYDKWFKLNVKGVYLNSPEPE